MSANGWIEVYNDYYEQQLASTAKFFAKAIPNIDRPAQFSPLSVVKFKIDGVADNAIETELRGAWRALRYHSPSIATCAVPGGEKRSYQVPNAEALKIWEATTFHVHPNGDLQDTYTKLLHHGTIHVHYFPGVAGTHTIVFEGDHSAIDGRGSLYIVHSFFSTLSNPQLKIVPDTFGAEVSRLPPTQDDLMHISQPYGDDQMAEIFKWLPKLEVPAPSGLPLTPLQLSLSPTRPIQPRVLLSKDTSAAVLGACRSKGLTVTHAWTAAMALAVLRTQAFRSQVSTVPDDLNAGSRLFSFSAMDTRPFFKDDRYDPFMHNTSCYHLVLPFLVDGNKSFLESAAELKNVYTKSLTPERRDAIGALYDIQTRAIGGASSVSMSTFSSYGNMNNVVRESYDTGNQISVEIKDVQAGVASRMPWTNWMLMTWDGVLCITCAANEAYFPNGEIEQCLELCRDILLDGLGVELTD